MKQFVNETETSEVRIRWIEEGNYNNIIKIICSLFLFLQVVVLLFHFFRGNRMDLSFAMIYGVLMLQKYIDIYRLGEKTIKIRKRIISCFFSLLVCLMWQILFVFDI